MNKVAAQIGCTNLMVGIPFKGTLIATDSTSVLRFKFPAVIKKYYEKPQQDTISDMVFLLQNGNIIAMGGESDGDDQAVPFSVIEDGNTSNYKVKIICNTVEELKEHVTTSYQQVIMMIMTNQKFGGEVSYYLLGDIILNNELIERCNSFVKQIKENEMVQTIIQALTKNGLNISFYHQDKKIAPSDSTNESETKLIT